MFLELHYTFDNEDPDNGGQPILVNFDYVELIEQLNEGNFSRIWFAKENDSITVQESMYTILEMLNGSFQTGGPGRG